MKFRMPLAAVAAIVAVWLAPGPATSMRIPERPHEDLGDVVHDSDPWVPDNRDPSGTLQGGSVSISRESVTGTRTLASAQESWTWRLYRILRVLYSGGLAR